MPDTIRVDSGRLAPYPRRRGFRVLVRTLLNSVAALVLPIGGAAAEGALPPATIPAYAEAFSNLDRHEYAALGLTLGVLLFAVVTAITLVRTRARAARDAAIARDEIGTLRADIDRANTLLRSEPQIIVAWQAAGNEPEIIGETVLVAPATAPHRVLAFGTWLDAEQAHFMERAVDRLREHGESLSVTLKTLSGRSIEAEGRAIGGRAVLRLRDVQGVKRDLSDLTSRYTKLLSEVDSLRAVIEAAPFPIWTRDHAGRLTFVNSAYAQAVEARDGSDATARELELLGSQVREEMARAHFAEMPFEARVPAIVAGARRTFDVHALPTARGSIAVGIDASEAEDLRAEIKRLNDAHRRTLDHLATGVAMFNGDRKLAFYNEAYRVLWELDAAFLDQGPSDSAVLDALRPGRKLPEQQDFRLWKAELHQAYQALEPREDTWHLPDGRTLRVVTTPNPQGGVTYLFDNVTERLSLERRFDALIRVQSETLDNLREAVAVFGSDGRLRLHNPAFADMWKLPDTLLNERPHIETLTKACQPLHGEAAFWSLLRRAVTTLDERQSFAARIERKDGAVIDCATVPLPDGATLVTFLDVTDTVNVERALRDRNDALETADQIKVDFVHHVSYELRSPLTNIIGFADFLADPNLGPLNERQGEYLGYLTHSTNALLAIINNILDLATIDAGVMTLDLGEVDINDVMQAAVEGVRDRLVKDDITLDTRLAPTAGSFVADERRLRQILFNLLSNAVSFSPPGETIVFSAERRPDCVVFAVMDHGPGIPVDMKDRVFKWFETHPLGSRHRGTGLGLSLVRSFVELHGGSVTIQSSVGEGTTVICTFPLDRPAAVSAAE
ncbi:MAG TPA: PAS-domain containing protein [Xanthobacteraceae bacterium]|jgi:signal transduction histidine kinase|nr:PAS-domain containing protein [Xanthobacteraceae bacterium]